MDKLDILHALRALAILALIGWAVVTGSEIVTRLKTLVSFR